MSDSLEASPAKGEAAFQDRESDTIASLDTSGMPVYRAEIEAGHLRGQLGLFFRQAEINLEP